MSEAAAIPDDVDPDTGEVIDEPNRPFVAFLGEMRRGATVDELQEALAEVVKRVNEVQKKGSLTFTISIGPGPGGEGAMFVADDIKTKLPKPDKDASIFYADNKGDLTRTNPRQMSLGEGLRSVPES